MEGMLTAARGTSYCSACFTGKYPVVREEAKEAAAAITT